jgi:myo-inositol 2-dehydrogenase / D-chiro-inositol 1-dehydrogenase
MSMERIAVVGAGGMARVRTRALLATGQVMICGVAARHVQTAQKLAGEVGCAAGACFADVARLLETRPDAVLVEVPHEAQDPIVLWAVEQGLPVLIGGTLATSTTAAQRLQQLAEQRHLVLEAGYEARYSAAWEYAKRAIHAGELGTLVTVRALALYPADPTTWYYHERTSGGMPLTHMTYCFINPIRWIVGEVCTVAACANRIAHTAPELLQEENCVASLLFEHGVLCSLTAGFVAPPGFPAWSASFIGTRGALDVFPAEDGTGSLAFYRGGPPERHDFTARPNAFELQARAFVDALNGAVGACRNTPADTIEDVRVAEAIVSAARERRTVILRP